MVDHGHCKGNYGGYSSVVSHNKDQGQDLFQILYCLDQNDVRYLSMTVPCTNSAEIGRTMIGNCFR